MNYVASYKKKKSCLQSYNQIRLCLTLSGIRYMMVFIDSRSTWLSRITIRQRLHERYFTVLGIDLTFTALMFYLHVQSVPVWCSDWFMWHMCRCYCLLPVLGTIDYPGQPGHVAKHWVTYGNQVMWQFFGYPGIHVISTGLGGSNRSYDKSVLVAQDNQIMCEKC